MATGGSDKDRLLAASYWSPSLTSAVFQVVGNVSVMMEQLIMSVIGPNMTGRQSLIIRALTLSEPGHSFDGRDKMTPRTSSEVAVLNLKSSSGRKGTVSGVGSGRLMLLSSARRIDALAVFLLTDEKKQLNSFAVVFKSFEEVCPSWFLDGMTRLMIFQKELGLSLCNAPLRKCISAE